MTLSVPNLEKVNAPDNGEAVPFSLGGAGAKASQSPCHPFSRRPGRRGFTLVELLLVIAILTILAGITLPAVASLVKTRSFGQTLASLGGTLDQARQYAIAQNTYVWVAFAMDANKVNVVVIASPDGTDSSPSWSGSPAAGSTVLVPIAKVQTFNLTTLVTPNGSSSARTVTPATLPSSVGQPLNDTAAFALTLPGQTSSTTFNYAVQFTPTGQVRNTDGAPVDLVEFAIQPQRGPGIVDIHNGAAVQINGLTGQTRIYRQ